MLVIGSPPHAKPDFVPPMPVSRLFRATDDVLRLSPLGRGIKMEEQVDACFELGVYLSSAGREFRQ